jgi:hypothetical protein
MNATTPTQTEAAIFAMSLESDLAEWLREHSPEEIRDRIRKAFKPE